MIYCSISKDEAELVWLLGIISIYEKEGGLFLCHFIQFKVRVSRSGYR